MKKNRIVGCIGQKCPSACRAVWNKRFQEEGMHAVFLQYKTERCLGNPCTAKQCLHVRLSEMDLHGRFAYIIHDDLQKDVTSLLDDIDVSVEEGSVNIVMNEEGTLKGYRCESDDQIIAMLNGVEERRSGSEDFWILFD